LNIFEQANSNGVEIAMHDQHNKFAIKTWTLNNGITVSLKPSNIVKKQVTISALARGGISSLTDPEECMTAKILIPYIGNSGIGTFSPSALQQYDLDFDVSLDMHKRTIVASGGKEELETLFEIIHAFFSSPSFHENIWDKLLEKCSSNEMQKLKDPEVLFARHLAKLYSQDCILLDDFDAQIAKKNLCEPLFNHFFGAPNAFHFAISGDFTMEEITPLIKNYLGTLRSGSAEVGTGVEVIKTPAAVVDSKLHAGSSTNIKTVIGFVYPAKEILFNIKNQYASDLVSLILHRRLKNTLREELGQTYHVDVERFGPKDISSWNTVLQVLFTGQEAHRDSMINESLRTIESMKQDGVTEEELTFAKQALSQDYKRQQRSNYYWSYSLNLAHLFSFPYDVVLDYANNLSTIKCDDIKAMMGQMFNGSPPIVASLFPEKVK
jgi:zinc protease